MASFRRSPLQKNIYFDYIDYIYAVRAYVGVWVSSTTKALNINGEISK